MAVSNHQRAQDEAESEGVETVTEMRSHAESEAADAPDQSMPQENVENDRIKES